MYDLPDYRLEPPDPTPEEEQFDECIGNIEWCVDQIQRLLAGPDYDSLQQIKKLLEEALDAAEEAPDYRERW